MPIPHSVCVVCVCPGGDAEVSVFGAKTSTFGPLLWAQNPMFLGHAAQFSNGVIGCHVCVQICPGGDVEVSTFEVGTSTFGPLLWFKIMFF